MQNLTAVAKKTIQRFPIELLPPTIEPWDGTFRDLKKLILYEDKHLYVCYKPPQILSQSENSAGSLGEDDNYNLLKLLSKYQVSVSPKSRDYIGLVHRLDRPTSGLMVYARNEQSLKILSATFNPSFSEQKYAIKSYLAAVEGKLSGDDYLVNYLRMIKPTKTTVCDVANWKDGEKKEKLLALQSKLILPQTDVFSPQILTELARIDPNFKIAKMFYQTITSANINEGKRNQSNELLPEKYQSFLSVNLETGRKHQIRAQLSYLGYPVIGDEKYGASQRFSHRDICLHAYSLSFPHPFEKKRVLSFTIPPPRIWADRFPKRMMNSLQPLFTPFSTIKIK
jgi:23S rRNA-/tRNA-specific pseudouridylate synthase